MKTREQKTFGYYRSSRTEVELKEKFLDLIDDIFEQHRKQKCRESSERLKSIEDEYNKRRGVASYCEFKLFEKALELCRDLIEDNENLRGILEQQIEEDEGVEDIRIGKIKCTECLYDVTCQLVTHNDFIHSWHCSNFKDKNTKVLPEIDLEDIKSCRDCVYGWECKELCYNKEDGSCIHFIAKEGKE